MRDGDEYVINGQKMWTSLAGDADYCWLAVRTDPEAKKHKGISMIIVPMDTPGIKLMPLRPDGRARHQRRSSTTTCGCRLGNLVGGENNGWTLITNQLNHERVTLCSSGIVERALTDVRRWAQETKLADGRRVIDQEWVQLNLARVHARLEFLRLINWKVAWDATQERLDVGRRLDDQGVRHRVLPRGVPAAVRGPRPARRTCKHGLAGRRAASHGSSGYYRGLIILTFGGGTNEIQRDLIARVRPRHAPHARQR